jgi:hypothetical protein
MIAIRRKLALAKAVALALLVGACGSDTRCANPADPACQPPPPSPSPVANASPTPDPTPIPAALDVSGRWRSLARSWNFDLKQDGGTLSGVVVGFKNVSYAPDPSLQITGTISSSGDVAFSAQAFGIEFNGIAEAGGLRMTGTVRDCAGPCRNYGEVLEKK